MKRRVFGLGVGSVLLAGATWVACGSESEPTPGTGGADAGGGTSGTGGPSWGGGGAAPGGGGSSASGGTAGDGGIDWGAEPKWESTGQTAAGCAIERLVNPKEVKALVWKTCAWAADCEEAVFNPKLVGANAVFNPTSSVHDDGNLARIALAVISPKPITMLADATGLAADGIRSTESGANCYLRAASLWAGRFAAMIGPLGNAQVGGVLGEVGAGSVTTFTLTNPPPGSPQRYPLGSKRWLWWWVPVDRFSTVSAVDGSDFVMFAKAEQPGYAYAYNEPTSAGDIFLFDEYQATEAGSYQRVIAWSDGLQAPQTYLRPNEPENDFGSAGFAHSDLGLFKGIGRKGTNLYDAVELWTSPYSADSSKLVPKKVASVSAKSITTAWAGGFGRFAFPSFAPPNGKQEVLVWHLQTGANTSHVLPADHDVKAILGISRDHVYLGASKPNTGPSAYLVRYPVP